MRDLLICGGTVVDGTGAPGRAADVRIQDGRIVEVGPGLQPTGGRVIDATGAIVAPGFIDSHTHLDANIFWDPLCDPMVMHGVTSAVIGNCSLSFAPVRPQMRAALCDVFSYLEDIPVGVFKQIVPWNWETFEEYAAHVDGMKLGVNIAAFIGHSQLREYIVGPEALTRASTPAERARMVEEIDRAMQAGALGLSVSYFDRDRKGAKVPSQLADEAEMDAVLAVVGRYGGSLQFVATLERRMENIAYFGRLAIRHGVTLLHNALADRPEDPGSAKAVIAAIAGLQEQGARAYTMLSPRAIDFAVNFDQSLCFIALPAWNELAQADPAHKRELLKDEAWRKRGRHDFDTVTTSPLFPVHRLEKIRIVAANDPEHEKWVGRSIGEMVAARGGHPSDALADWVLENDLNTSFVNPVANHDPAGVAKLFEAPVVFISGSDAGAHLQMFSSIGDTTILLARYVRDRGDLTLERAVYELTGRQADIVGFADRGRIAVGMAGDVTIFRLEDLRFEDEELVRDVPGGQPRFRREDGGYIYTIVNGSIVQDHGKATGELPAGFLRLSRSRTPSPANA
jgi:N-acyl-D-aspartate/D-glutamate deacylase